MRFCSVLVFTCVAALSSPVLAERATPLKPDIAAVVGQQPLSTFDVDNRLKFIIVSSRLPNTPDVATRLKPQVIRSLIDEKLQLQEAAKYNITVSDQELTGTITGIEQSRGMKPGAIYAMLAEHKLPKETFTDQIRAQLAWRKLVIKKIRPGIRVSDDEIRLAALAPAAAAPQELKISVLNLPVDKPSQAAAVEATAQKLAKDLRDGASFEEVARQLGSTKSSGEQAFWVRPEQLDPTLARVLSSAKAGTITEPMRNANGIVIIKVYDVRATTTKAQADGEVLLKEILLKLKPSDNQDEADTLLTIAEAVSKHPGTCEEKGVAGIDNLDMVDIDVSMHRETLSELPEGIRTIAEGLKPGEISEPFASGGGLLLYMLCERKNQPLKETELAQIKEQIFQQKIELEAQKYLRDLRRDTYIDVRV